MDLCGNLPTSLLLDIYIFWCMKKKCKCDSNSSDADGMHRIHTICLHQHQIKIGSHKLSPCVNPLFPTEYIDSTAFVIGSLQIWIFTAIVNLLVRIYILYSLNLVHSWREWNLNIWLGGDIFGFKIILL